MIVDSNWDLDIIDFILNGLKKENVNINRWKKKKRVRTHVYLFEFAHRTKINGSNDTHLFTRFGWDE